MIIPSSGTASKTPPSNDLHFQNRELVQCYVGTKKPFWGVPFARHDHLAPQGWMAFTWQELSETSLSLKGPLATIPPRRALDLSTNEVMVRDKWEPSRCKLLNEVRLHMGVTCVSDMCNAAGTHILPEVSNCQCQSHTLRSPGWPNVTTKGGPCGTSRPRSLPLASLPCMVSSWTQSPKCGGCATNVFLWKPRRPSIGRPAWKACRH